MQKFILFFVFLINCRYNVFSQIEISGKITDSKINLADVNIDLYEYNSRLITINTNKEGAFKFNLKKGKEYVVLFYKSGYQLKAYNFSNQLPENFKFTDLEITLLPDANSPEGLFFKEIDLRATHDKNSSKLSFTKFDLAKIKPRSHADSLTVLINRATTNQYLLISNMKIKSGAMNSSITNTKGMETAFKNEMEKASERAEKMRIQASLYERVENQFVAESKRTADDTQLEALTNAQKALSDRLSALTNHYMAQQERALAESKLKEIQSANYAQMALKSTVEEEKNLLEKNSMRYKAAAMSSKMEALQMNEQFEFHNKLFALNYQEYIELLRYKNKKEDVAIATKQLAQSQENIQNNIHFQKDKQVDSLMHVEPELRSDIIQNAIAEEERFKNFTESESNKEIQGEKYHVKTTRISNDIYELLIDKKFNFKYLKNGKAVTKLTYEFETKRRFIDVMNTLKKVEKFAE